MPMRRGPSREVYAGLGLERAPRKRRWWLAILLAALLGFALYVSLYLRTLSSATALSDARDKVTLAVNAAVSRVLREENFGYGDFVTLERDGSGNLMALTTDTRRVNLLSAEVLTAVSEAAENGELDIRVPLGNLLGSNLLLGRGPAVPVRVTMLTSPVVRFEHEFTATGINQTRHALTLVTEIDVDLLIPWATLSTEVDTEVLVAETVIVGKVPDTYFDTER